MTDYIKKILFSTRLMAVLFIVFATAMAFGTFVESWYSTETARIWIYNAKWFEAIMVFFVINFIGNIWRYKLLRKEKWAVLLLHISWILIILGAFVTRYISYEGIMPIREGATESYFFSEKTYVTVLVDGEIDGQALRKELKDDVLVSKEGIRANFPWNDNFNKQDFTISYAGFIEGADEGLIPDENGDEYLKIVEAGGGNRHDHYLKNGEIVSIHNVLFALNKPTRGAINIRTTDSIYTIESPFEGDFMRMADQFRGTVAKDSVQPLMLRSLYNTAGMQFVFPEPLIKGSYGVIELPEDQKTKNSQDAIILNVTTQGQTEQIKLLGGKGIINDPRHIALGGLDFYLSYGSIRQELPFSIKLNDFIAEKYPGTENGYSSFMSKITVNDERSFDYEIFMNNVLDHGGYRFFQASFQPDEKGTVLSVNHDFWGTWITYIGYFLLYLGLMGIMFYGKTRFRDLGKMLEKIKEKKSALSLILILATGFSGLAQQTDAHTEDDGHVHNALPTPAQIDSVLYTTKVLPEHAAKFGALVIQDDGGRMKPVNTFASELLRKISKNDVYKDMDANQVFLSMIQNPAVWFNIDFMYLKRGNDSIRSLIGVDKDQKYVKAIDFFDAQGNYKLAPYLQEAYSTNTPNQFQKDFKETDQKLGLLNRALGGQILKIFPLPEDDNNKWVSAVEFNAGQLEVKDSLYSNFIKRSLPFYMLSLRQAKASGNYEQADKLLEAFKQNQQNYGSEVLPSDKKVNAEILYNKYDIFKKLFSWYMYAGTLMFIFLIIQIFKDRKAIGVLIKISKIAIVVLFILHTAGLIARWYISGHAPWSDAYESMIYVAWATMALGLAFAKKSDLTIAATAFVTSMILMIAHWNWMDPAIANLQPVLNSYWLMIHVSVIVGSYGPFTLGMILGVVSLLLMLMTTKKNKKKMELNIQELTVINELALTVGLVMLTIGNFLGGQWANESWGRYWGWDPKETWALISIMVYAFVIHMRLVPGLRGKWIFNFFSIVAYASIMMTYFGVNFYLTGLHSYASGEKIITPNFVYYSVVVVFILGALSFWRYKKHYAKA
ncbi:cytochrome C biogenesis protein [Leptobacterium flavescens]|uniref:Cytochrome C biogenesis protein n=1 Tax=Leptobacterium flavescens TaxID=472055 RepID=A0A6P0ULY4_9FLAO|nr:cytochrome c biogenesis protein CcsA [Leptobacterium flavescens]NER14027.1 cytochrome C biogenesis protein [Leptobacterium flavescens]